MISIVPTSLDTCQGSCVSHLAWLSATAVLPAFCDSHTCLCVPSSAATGGVLVHCQAGVSRSASVVIGYLMWKEQISYQEAYAAVKRCRPIIWPNDGFICQLQEFEQAGKDVSKWQGWSMQRFLTSKFATELLVKTNMYCDGCDLRTAYLAAGDAFQSLECGSPCAAGADRSCHAADAVAWACTDSC